MEDTKEKEKEVKNIKVFGKLKSLDKMVEDNSIIDDYLLDSITSRIRGLFLTSISIYRPSRTNRVSDNKWSIAELGKSLESITDFQDIFISSISKEEQYYNFIINISLKVNLNGKDESIEEDETQRTMTKNEKMLLILLE